MKTFLLALTLTAILCLNSNCVNSTSQKSPTVTDGDSLNTFHGTAKEKGTCYRCRSD
jgi:hypothetical protein